MIPTRLFDGFVVVMFWSAAGIFALAMGLMVLLLLTRIRAIARRRRTQYLVNFWREVFTGAKRPRAGRVTPRDAFTVLSLWNDFHRVRDEGAPGVRPERLREVARRYGLDLAAERLLARGDAGDRLVALTFMSYAPAPASVERVIACASSELGELSLAAQRALVAMNPAYMAAFAHAIAGRDDYRASSVEKSIAAIGPAIATAPITALAVADDPPAAMRLLRFFPLLETEPARRAIRRILERDPGPDLAAAALRALAPFVQPEDGEIVRRFLTAGPPFVRIAAVGALQPICETSDRDALLKLLADRDSWVRYRAAQVLVERFTREGVEGDLRREIADRYARDALTQVLAERSVIELREFVAQETGEEANAPERVALPLRRAIDEMRTQA